VKEVDMMTARRLLIDSVLVALGVGMIGSTALAAEPQPPLLAVLSGGTEVGPGGAANAGDANGYGSATINVISATTLCYAVVVDRIDAPIAMHVHEASAGSNGGIAIGLTPPATGSPGTSAECLTGLDPAILSRMRGMTTNFYINVHTGNFPGGAIRGQLF
jgi:hypothetical protein